jgi:hypothetical protein
LSAWAQHDEDLVHFVSDFGTRTSSQSLEEASFAGTAPAADSGDEIEQQVLVWRASRWLGCLGNQKWGNGWPGPEEKR